MSHYRRIACLSTEAVETLYAIGAQDLVAGISGYSVYPPQARREKPKISGFSSARIDRILAESGVAKMTLYKHFRSKDELIQAVLQSREQSVLGQLAALRASGDGWQTRINDSLRASLVLAGKLA